MKIAVLSDIHGNILALEAVLKDIELRGPDLIFCLGDLVGYGAFPNEVISLISRRRIPTIMGNYDEGVGYDKDDCGCAYKDERLAKLGHQSLAWTKYQVSAGNKDFLRGLFRRLEFTIYDKKVLLVHGSPRRINEYLFEDRPVDSIERLFEAEQADVIICGHTHLPYERNINCGYLINSGSVGKPKDGDLRAGYAMLDITAENVMADFVRVNYDVDGSARAIEDSGLPVEFAGMLRKGE